MSHDSILIWISVHGPFILSICMRRPQQTPTHHRAGLQRDAASWSGAEPLLSPHSWTLTVEVTARGVRQPPSDPNSATSLNVSGLDFL